MTVIKNKLVGIERKEFTDKNTGKQKYIAVLHLITEGLEMTGLEGVITNTYWFEGDISGLKLGYVSIYTMPYGKGVKLVGIQNI